MKNRLGLVLLAMDVTQNELANRIYASPQTVNYYVNGHRMPSVETALRIAKALGVKVEDIWLLCGDEWKDSIACLITT